MLRKLSSFLSRSTIFPISTRPILKLGSYPQSSRLHSSSLKMSDSAQTPNSPAIPSVTKPELLRALEFHLGSSFSVDPVTPPPNPLIIVISGASGVGKDAVINKLREARESLQFVVTATTRAIRPGEIDGRDYFFVSKDEFLSMVEKDELLEHALVYGDYKGIPKKQIREFMDKGYDIVLRVDVQGAQTLRKILGNSAVFIFLVADSELAMVERLVDRRTESHEELLVRVATAREEIRHVKDFDYVVVNAKGNLEDSVKRVESIIDAEKSKVRQRMNWYQSQSSKLWTWTNGCGKKTLEVTICDKGCQSLVESSVERVRQAKEGIQVSLKVEKPRDYVVLGLKGKMLDINPNPTLED